MPRQPQARPAQQTQHRTRTYDLARFFSAVCDEDRDIVLLVDEHTVEKAEARVLWVEEHRVRSDAPIVSGHRHRTVARYSTSAGRGRARRTNGDGVEELVRARTAGSQPEVSGRAALAAMH